jgi:hypothetical protein
VTVSRHHMDQHGHCATCPPVPWASPHAARQFSRRTMLRAGAVAIGLPLLDAFRGERRSVAAETPAAATAPRRLVLVGRPLGYHAAFLFPERPGRDYETTRYLAHLEPVRGEFTVVSGISHPEHRHHQSEVGLFTGVEWERIAEPSRELRNSISLDQLVAERIGADTRYRNLVLGKSNWPTSWTSKGMAVPAENRPTAAFRTLFLDGAADEVAAELRRLSHGRSILDRVREEAASLSRDLGADDRRRIELLFSSIRDAEQALARSAAWAHTPKPKVDHPAPTRDPSMQEVTERERLWFDIARLALATDSTRVILLSFGEVGVPKVAADVNPELVGNHHDSSHHGLEEGKIAKLATIEDIEMREFGRFLETMRGTAEGDGTLLDHTVVVSASNLGNASAHSSENLPVIVAGGGLRHAGHLAFDRTRNQRLCNLFVRVAQQVGVDIESFGTSDGIVSDL